MEGGKKSGFYFYCAENQPKKGPVQEQLVQNSHIFCPKAERLKLLQKLRNYTQKIKIQHSLGWENLEP